MELIHHHFETLPSTNDWAKEHLESFKKTALTLVTAGSQTGGRGQFGRSWHSPKGWNLYASYCLFSENPDGFAYTRLMAEALVATLAPLPATIKWPNDVQINGKKIAGVLTETSGEGVIIGVGLNINMPQEALDSIDQPATSLFVETGKEYSVESVREALTGAFRSKL